MRIEEGKRYLLKKANCEYYEKNIFGYNDMMKAFAGKIITVGKVIDAKEAGLDLQGYGDTYFTINECFRAFNFNANVISKEVKPQKAPEIPVSEIGVGDIVTVKEFEEIMEYCKNSNGFIEMEGDLEYIGRPRLLWLQDVNENYVIDPLVFNDVYDKKAIVTDVEDEGRKIKFRLLADKDSNDDEDEIITHNGFLNVIVRRRDMEEKVQEEVVKFAGYSSDDEAEAIKQEMLSKIDRPLINKILSASYRKKATDMKGIDVLLNRWAEAKRDIYLMLGRNLKIEEEITYEKTDSDLRTELMGFFEKYPIAYPVLREYSMAHIKNNKSLSFGSDYSKYIDKISKSGMKISALLSNLTKIPQVESYKSLTPEEVEIYTKLKEKVTTTSQMDIDYSKITEDMSVKGKICISIDPLDYLLMSVNKSGWDSCYSIAKDGESRHFGQFASGVFAYMCDTATTIAYRHSDSMPEFKIGNSKFNAYSKSWRQVIFVDTENLGFLTSRQYPFHNEQLAGQVREMLEDKMSETSRIDNKWGCLGVYSKNGDCHIDKYKNKITMSEESRHVSYNDIIRDNDVEDAKFVYNKILKNKKDIRFDLDIVPICPVCGEYAVQTSSKPYCRNCAD